ncbi:MAG: DUF4386 domain-containing protein [Bacteroidetes bacterium]|nr:MAG: DUF4386 domain-containing protein [Bacteroidota bacterium]
MTNIDFELQIKRNAKISGFLFLLIILSSLLALAILDPKIKTITDIIENEVYFRVDVAYTLFMYICVIILATYLYRTLKHINKTLASIAWALRLAEGILGGVKVLCFLIVLLLLNGENHSQLFEVDQLHALAEVFRNAYWAMTIVIFSFLGLGSIAFFMLFLKSRYIPKAISIWGICSYALVVLGSFISIIFDNNAFMILGSQTIIFEIFIGAWLLFKGINLQPTDN